MLGYCIYVLATFCLEICQGFGYSARMNAVQIVESPESTYIVDDGNATLSCRAFNAKQVRFKCNDTWLKENRHKITSGTDGPTGLGYITARVEITQDEVENVVGSFQSSDEDSDDEDRIQRRFYCECFADGGEFTQIKSDKAFVEIAFIREDFNESPHSKRIREGSTDELRCIPPHAVPKPEVVWYKDGKQIDRRDNSHYIYSNDNSLLISTISLADEGNYHCTAKNPVGIRSSDTAHIEVFVDGEWGGWSPWSECISDCNSLKKSLQRNRGNQRIIEQDLPMQSRSRECNNPAPLNGGNSCPGPGVESRQCDIECVIDGHWTPWTSWSECTSSCYEIRTRTCSAPPAMNGGRNCTGNELETRSCTPGTGQCRTIVQSPSFESSSIETQLAMYAGLGSVVILLLLIFLLMLILFCRWRRCCFGSRRNDIYFAENSGHVRTVLLQQKQRLLGDPEGVKIIPSGSEFYTLTTTASPAHAVVHPSTFTLRSVRSGNSGYSSTRQGAGSRTALIAECSSSNSSNGKTTLGECSSSQVSDDNYATLYDYVGDQSERYGSVQMVTLPQVFTPAYFNKSGGRIELKKSGVSLSVPENALPSEQTIYIAISDDTNDRPKLPEGDTVLSATVMTGLCDGNDEEPILHRPIIVSFKHCASNFPKDNWTFMLYAKKNFDGIWEMVAKIGEENINTPVYCQMEHYRCHVMTEQFGKLVLVGRPKKMNGMATKRVRIAAFGPQKPAREAMIQVYCVPETGVAFRRVLEREANNGVLLAQIKDFLLRETGSLCVRFDGPSSGIYPSPPSQYYEIQETHRLWCLQSGVHCDLNVMIPNDVSDQREGRVLVYQRGNADARQALEFDLQKPLVCEDLEEECPVSVAFQLDSEIRWRLADLLDTPTDPEKDWRGLAKKLDLHRYIQYFATRPGLSPTSLLLDMWEAMTAGSQEAVFGLLQKLRTMGRTDAVIILDHYLP